MCVFFSLEYLDPNGFTPSYRENCHSRITSAVHNSFAVVWLTSFNNGLFSIDILTVHQTAVLFGYNGVKTIARRLECYNGCCVFVTRRRRTIHTLRIIIIIIISNPFSSSINHRFNHCNIILYIYTFR